MSRKRRPRASGASPWSRTSSSGCAPPSTRSWSSPARAITAGAPDAAYEEAGATLGDPWGAEVVAKVAPPSDDEVAQARLEHDPRRLPEPARQPRRARGDRQDRRDRAGDGEDPAHQPRAVDGRAVLPGHGLRLPRGADRGDRARALLPDVHDRGRHRPARAGARARRRRRRACRRSPPRAGSAPSSPAFDIRSAVKEQIQSLGAKFFEVEGIGDAEAAGGYARELTPEEQQIQRDALSRADGPQSDVIITTALVPGRPAPKLIPADRGAADEARQRDRRPRRRGGRQLRAGQAGGDVHDRQRRASSPRRSTSRRRWPSTRRRSTPATSSA